MAEGIRSQVAARADLQRVATTAVLNLRCRIDSPQATAAIADALGVDLPRDANRWAGGDTRAVVWLGPDEWLLLDRDGDAAAIERRIRAAAGDDPWLSVVDLSHAYVTFTLTGAAAREVLAKGCSLDLDASHFGVHDCAQSLLAGTNVLLRCRQQAIDILVRNSFAPYAGQWLADALAEFDT